MFDQITEKLKRRLSLPLPGMEAQRVMMPAESAKARFNLDKTDVKRGGVLILLYPKNGHTYLPLTLRPDYGGTHSGQVSLPGGKYEKEDGHITNTALRETHEEIGVNSKHITVLGTLTDLYIPPSNFRVTPVVGVIPKEPSFAIDTFEVQKLIETPVDHLLDEERKKRKDILVRNGRRINAPYFDIHGMVVWGATAMILSEFKMILEEITED
ncbi:MAG: CoA pyrophosphatase [Fulvivirga sp.]|nr:CoA pyrophosphatase [Fulvivirga sp.]